MHPWEFHQEGLNELCSFFCAARRLPSVVLLILRLLTSLGGCRGELDTVFLPTGFVFIT